MFLGDKHPSNGLPAIHMTEIFLPVWFSKQRNKYQLLLDMKKYVYFTAKTNL